MSATGRSSFSSLHVLMHQFEVPCLTLLFHVVHSTLCSYDVYHTRQGSPFSLQSGSEEQCVHLPCACLARGCQRVAQLRAHQSTKTPTRCDTRLSIPRLRLCSSIYLYLRFNVLEIARLVNPFRLGGASNSSRKRGAGSEEGVSRPSLAATALVPKNEPRLQTCATPYSSTARDAEHDRRRRAHHYRPSAPCLQDRRQRSSRDACSASSPSPDPPEPASSVDVEVIASTSRRLSSNKRLVFSAPTATSSGPLATEILSRIPSTSNEPSESGSGDCTLVTARRDHRATNTLRGRKKKEDHHHHEPRGSKSAAIVRKTSEKEDLRGAKPVPPPGVAAQGTLASLFGAHVGANSITEMARKPFGNRVSASGAAMTGSISGISGAESPNGVTQERTHQRVSRIYPLTESVVVAQRKKTPVEVKFHPITSSFMNEARLEKLYQVTFARENSPRSMKIASIFFLLYLLFTGANLTNLFSSDSKTRREALSYCFLVFIPILPIPFLIYLSRRRQFEIQFQRIYTVILVCWCFSIIAGGMFSMLTEWYSYVAKDINIVMQELKIADTDDATVFYLNSTVRTDWEFKEISGTRTEVLQVYTREILLPAATMNINLLRLVMIFVFVPLLRIDTVHFILVGVITIAAYIALTITYYPTSDSTPFIQNRILVICFPIMFAVAMLLRNRDVDRVVRQDFLHVWAVELEAEKATREKNLIAEENRTLKQELAKRDTEFNLDLTSPLHSLLAELKAFIDEVDMSEQDTQRGMSIVRNLAKLDTNLFMPDISAQMKSEKEVDSDTKNWALSVLARKEYTGVARTAATTSHSSHSNSDPRRSYKDGRVDSLTQIIMPIEDMPAWEDEIVAHVKARIQQDGWDLDTLKIAEMTQNHPLMYVTAAMFEIHELHEEFRVDRTILRNFLFLLDEGYLANPYHNSSHAADVVNSVNYLITRLADGQIRDTLTNLEFYAALVAAAIHDFRHPGKSNNYLIKAKHDLAIQYNDRSILESMHVAETFFIMRSPQCDIFGRMKDKPYREIRKAIIEMVLSTDLSMHLQLVGNLKALLMQGDGGGMASGPGGGGNGGAGGPPKLVTDPMMIMKVVIKCADIGHAAKERKLHVIWSSLIIEEFFLQGDNERANNSDISPFMDRHSENSAKNQVGFFEFIVLPFYETVSQVIFTPDFAVIHNIAKQNYNLWKESDRRQLSSIVAIKNEVFLNDKVQVP